VDETGTDQEKVLFVDDEVNVLRSIQRAFIESPFLVLTAPGAREGLDILERENVDIVVTDFRMPYMDGLQFLNVVRELYPRTARVILSGYIEKSVAVESLTRGLASTFILKPWLNRDVEQKIEHLLETRRILQSKELLNIINGITNLPTLSNIFQEFMTAVDEERSMAEIARIIQKEPSVATKALQIANSAFYGKKHCTSIDKAAVTLGLETLQDILLTISVIGSMKWSRDQLFPLQDIFVRSFIMNYYLPVLYTMKPDVLAYKSFPSVGLTYDVGMIILLQFDPDRFRRLAETMDQHPGMDFHTAELLLGFEDCTHQEIGAYFLDYWNLPQVFIETALFHHSPDRASVHYRDIVEMTNYIETLVLSVYKRDDETGDGVEGLRKDFIPKKKFQEMMEDIREKLEDRMTFVIPH
jgi:HD-like signal output (HDOD) protein/CheY-like chemotaxis protein